MKWEKPVCRICKKPIQSPWEASIPFGTITNEYYHIGCFGKELKETSKFSRIAYVAGINPASLVGIEGNISRAKAAAGTKSWEKHQAYITNSSNGGLILAIVFDALFIIGLLNMTKLRFDAVGWVAFALFGLVCFAISYIVGVYRWRLWKHQQLLRQL